MKSWEEIIINGNREDGKYHNPPSMQIGVVKSIEPLQIVYGDLPLGRDNLLIDKRLIDYTEEVEATTDTSHEHSHVIKEIKHKSILKINDRVVLYEISEGSKYYVMGVIADE